MIPYDDKQWRYISPDTPAHRVENVLLQVRPNLAERYGTPAALNSLFCWTQYEQSWPIQAFVLRYGLSRPNARPLSPQEIANLLGKTRNGVLRAYGTGGVPTRLVVASHLLANMPPEARIRNEFREIGLPPSIWEPLVTRGKIFTLEQLCELTEHQTSGISRISSAKVGEIKTRLASAGRALRAS